MGAATLHIAAALLQLFYTVVGFCSLPWDTGSRHKPRGFSQALASHPVGLSRYRTLAPKLCRSNPYDAKGARQSTDVWNPFLSFDFGCCNGLRRKLEHRCFLTLKHIIQ